MDKIKIMFVCHGNICRSPMAEIIMKDLLSKQGMLNDFQICSSATSTEEIWNGVGNPIYPPARRELEKHGLNAGNKRAVQLKASDYPRFDLFIGMDSANIRNTKTIFGDDPQCKIKKLMDYTDRKTDVADPWYSGDFEMTYNDIHEGCTALIKHLTKKGK